jgi:hypothetical protein
MNDLRPPQSDFEIAAEFKAKIRNVIEAHLIPVLCECAAAGLSANFGIGPDGLGRPSLQSVQIVKPL